jgi:hypothetical protein
MAKSTRAQGATFTSDELADPTPPPVVQRSMLGGDPSSVGTHSSELSSNAPQSNESETPNRPELVPTMESLSNQTDTEDSTVGSTDGDGQTETVLPYDEWDYRELQAECKERGLSAGGSAEDLIFRLEEFDATNDGDEDDEDFN